MAQQEHRQELGELGELGELDELDERGRLGERGSSGGKALEAVSTRQVGTNPSDFFYYKNEEFLLLSCSFTRRR